jgi:hypothetical protein
MTEGRFFVGQRVLVRSADEALSTVNDNGTLYGLPLCRKCLTDVENCFASSDGSTKPASMVTLLYADYLWQKCSAV